VPSESRIALRCKKIRKRVVENAQKSTGDGKEKA
jgi:hypothetical protein